MLDDLNIIKQRDPGGALVVASQQCKQAESAPEVINYKAVDKPIYNIIIAGMGGSALAALMLKTWLKSEMSESIEIVRGYQLPRYVNQDTLVIVSSYSGNTEEALACLDQARNRQAQLAIVSSGGELIKIAKDENISHVVLLPGIQPRYGVISNLSALLSLMISFKIVNKERLDEVVSSASWLTAETAKWIPSVSTNQNYAKVLALEAVGKTAVFYGGELSAPVAYKWKISWNENAKNLAFYNELPEFNHNEFLGWSSHPVEKPFAVFDIISNLENSQILRRFEITDRLLSGLRPKSIMVKLEGESLIKQMLWGSILADFVSIYLGILNNVDPTRVDLIEKFKSELK